MSTGNEQLTQGKSGVTLVSAEADAATDSAFSILSILKSSSNCKNVCVLDNYV